MKTIRNEVRPIGFVTVELTENEVQTLIGVFEEICYLKDRHITESLGGTRKELYDQFKFLININK